MTDLCEADEMAGASYAARINAHYSQPGLGQQLISALERAGRNIDALTREDITRMDEFHIRGREATRELAQLAQIGPETEVLDLGCGLGGPARTLAAECGCRVVGLDLVEEYCQAAALLTQRVGLANRVRFETADAGAPLPFEDGTFDRVWTQHTIMNIKDKAAMCSEIRRVLKPGGRYVFYEVCTGAQGDAWLPVPWASDADINFVVSPEEFRHTLQAAGFFPVHWQDVSESCLVWFRNVAAAAAARSKDKAPALGVNLIMGTNVAEKQKNMVRNLAENRIVVIQGVFGVSG